jgi:hypothetical protein
MYQYQPAHLASKIGGLAVPSMQHHSVMNSATRLGQILPFGLL